MFLKKTYIKRYSTSLIMREMIKTTMVYHLTPVRMAPVNKTSGNKIGEEMEKKNTLEYRR